MTTQTQKDAVEWLEVSSSIVGNYHLRQFDQVNRSTVKFCDWLETLGLLDRRSAHNVADLGAGFGANIHHMSRRYPASRFIGIELNPTFAKTGAEILRERGSLNAQLEQGDLYALDAHHVGAYDGIVSYQVLSWLPEYSEPIRRMAALQPRWIALTSLFYDGPINTIVRTQDYTLPVGGAAFRESYYNVYSLMLIQKHFADLGFRRFEHMPFEIDIDLAKPVGGGMQSYTERMADGRRLQFGGPLLLSWHFVAAERV